VYKPDFCLSTDFLGDKSGITNFLGSEGTLLLLVGFLLGLRKRGLGNRQHGTHGSFQPLEGCLWCSHGEHNTTCSLGGLQ
jgi:hypothetical protein